MKFAKYLANNLKPEWQEGYLDYVALKTLIKDAVRASEDLGSDMAFSPRETSLSVQRVTNLRDAAEEDFYTKLEFEVRKVKDYTSQLVAEITAELQELSQKSEVKTNGDTAALQEEAKLIGEKYLALEKYINLNFMGFQKTVKKHDKQLPHAPCQQFYMHILRTQTWVQNDYSDLLIKLSAIYGQLRGEPTSAIAIEAEVRRGGDGNMPAGSQYVSTLQRPSHLEQATNHRCWVKQEDISTVTHHIMQHLPVQTSGPDGTGSNTELVNVVYLDNASLELYHALLDKRPNAVTYRITWEGPSVPEFVTIQRLSHRPSSAAFDSLVLPETLVVAFLKGELRVADVTFTWRSLGKSETEIRDAAQLFDEIQRVIESKQLAPILHTRAVRTTFATPSDPTVLIAMDGNIQIIREIPFQLVTADRWYRDATLMMTRKEITRFPHMCMDVRLKFPATHTMPEWLQELLNSETVTVVDSFSKMLHGVATLLPDLAQAVPYWVDDVTIRDSMNASSEEAPRNASRGAGGPGADPRGAAPRRNISAASHPLLGDQPTLQLIADRTAGAGSGISSESKSGFFYWWFLDRRSVPPPLPPANQVPLLNSISERKAMPAPKNVFALERTYLTWTHMAVTVGSVSVGMLGFSGGSTSTQTSGTGVRHTLLALCSMP